MADFIINPTVTTMNAPVFNLVNTSMNAVSYAWYNDDNQLLSTDKDLVRTEEKTGQYCYTLKVKNKCGEESVARKCADIVENGRIEMPNAFSPNGDGKNDVIKPVIIGRLSDQGYRFTLYNRWGQQLFNSMDPQAGWNGMQKGVPCEMGVYFYVIKAKDLTGKEINLKGDITLLR